MITKGRPKSTNIVDRRSETKKASKTNGNNNNSLTSFQTKKRNDKAAGTILSSRTDMGEWRPRPLPRKVDSNADSPGRASKTKKYNRAGR